MWDFYKEVTTIWLQPKWTKDKASRLQINTSLRKLWKFSKSHFVGVTIRISGSGVTQRMVGLQSNLPFGLTSRTDLFTGSWKSGLVTNIVTQKSIPVASSCDGLLYCGTVCRWKRWWLKGTGREDKFCPLLREEEFSTPPFSVFVHTQNQSGLCPHGAFEGLNRSTMRDFQKLFLLGDDSFSTSTELLFFASKRSGNHLEEEKWSGSLKRVSFDPVQAFREVASQCAEYLPMPTEWFPPPVGWVKMINTDASMGQQNAVIALAAVAGVHITDSRSRSGPF